MSMFSSVVEYNKQIAKSQKKNHNRDYRNSSFSDLVRGGLT